MKANNDILNIGDDMNNLEYGKLLAIYFYENLLNTINPKIWSKRNSKIGVIKRISPEIPNGIYDISNILNYEKYNSVVEKFKSVLDEKLPHCNNRGFYERIERLQLYEKEKHHLNPTASGRYYDRKNILEIYLKNIKSESCLSEEQQKEEVITHELLHMATTYQKGSVILCGFGQSIGNNFRQGIGINEGYTELLNMRYFNHKIPSHAYLEEQLIALGFEQIIGRKKMESLYFDADLMGLIKEVEKYAPAHEITQIIGQLDKAMEIQKTSKDEYIAIIRDIRAKLANINMEKQRHLLMSGQITTDEYDYENLKSAFYVKGFILDKYKDLYCVRPNGHKYGKLLTQEGYRILSKKFNKEVEASKGFTKEYATPTENDVVNTLIGIDYLTNVENKNLQEIESIEVIDAKTFQYQITQRKQKNTKREELDEMFKKQNIESSMTTRKIG